MILIDKEKFIRLENISKEYITAAGVFSALRNIDLTIGAGEFVGVVGKSGCGKSTLINMLTGIDRPSNGEIWVGDDPLHKFGENEMAIWRRYNMGIVFQFFQLMPMLTVLDNVLLPMDFCGTGSYKERKRRAMELLEMVDMGSQADKLPYALSGGQQQRVAIARALANNPGIIVADEPTGNLDTHTAGNIFNLFVELADKGVTVIIVTHDDDLAVRTGKLIRILDGEIVEDKVNAIKHK